MVKHMRFIAAAVVLLVMLLPGQAQAQDTGSTVYTTTNLNMREGPGEEHDIVKLLLKGTALVLQEPLDGRYWVKVRTADSAASGWVSTCCIAANAPQQGAASQAAAGESARTQMGVNLRKGPGEDYDIVKILPRGTEVTITGGADGVWLPVRTADGTASGWLVETLLDRSAPAPAAAPGDNGLDQALANVSPEYEAELIARLSAVPVVPGVTARSREIFARGQELGNNPHTVSKAGDCNMASGAFLRLIALGQYELGSYTGLQPTVSYFLDSFYRESIAANRGFTTTIALDPVMSDPTLCQGEPPLECEYSINRPAAAFLMFGPSDVHYLTHEEYRQGLREVVQLSIDRGVIPILVTNPTDRSENSLWIRILEYNLIMVEVAREYDVPLLNLWLATREMPHSGVEDDLLHLTYNTSAWIKFNGEENQWGYTRLNLIALQTLDALRQGIPLP